MDPCAGKPQWVYFKENGIEISVEEARSRTQRSSSTCIVASHTLESATVKADAEEQIDSPSTAWHAVNDSTRELWLKLFEDVSRGDKDDRQSLSRKEFIRVVRRFPVLAARLQALLRLPEDFGNDGALARVFQSMDLEADTIDADHYVVAKAILRRFDEFHEHHCPRNDAEEESKQGEGGEAGEEKKPSTWRHVWRKSVLGSIKPPPEEEELQVDPPSFELKASPSGTTCTR